MQTLTDNQIEFCRQRIAGKTQKDAYALAYPRARFWKHETREQAGCRLEARPHIKAVIQAARRQKLTRAVEDGIIDGVDIMRELAAIGFSDVTSVVTYDKDSGVAIKSTADLSREERVPIAGIRETKDGGVEIKFHSKLQALKLLGDSIGLFDHNASQSTWDVAQAIEDAWKDES